MPTLMRNAGIASSSVNSILCSYRNNSNSKQLVVGNQVSIINGHIIQASFTTKMPDNPSIQELMYLLFAPRVRLIPTAFPLTLFLVSTTRMYR